MTLTSLMSDIRSLIDYLPIYYVYVYTFNINIVYKLTRKLLGGKTPHSEVSLV